MSELKKFTVHLHATFTPTAEVDGESVVVVMGDPEVTECDCEPTPGSTFAHRMNAMAGLPWATFQNSGGDEADDQAQGEPVSDEIAGHEVARITITRIFTDDGDDVIGVDHSDDITAIEALGMLEMAKENWSAFRPGDDED